VSDDLTDLHPHGIARTARKLHSCYDCEGEIRPGDRYWEDRADVADWEAGRRYCRPCAIRWGRPTLGRAELIASFAETMLGLVDAD